jgi:hypothetical protein
LSILLCSNIGIVFAMNFCFIRFSLIFKMLTFTPL